MNVAASLREHFHKTRKTFRRELEDIPIANRAVRLRALDRMARRFEEMGNLLGAMAALEHAAKEMGRAYAGRGGAVDVKPVEPSEPRSPGADVLAEIGRRFTVVKGCKAE